MRRVIGVGAWVAWAAVASAGEEAAPSRAEAQARGKAAAVATKLPESEVGPLFADVERVVARYAHHVQTLGPAAAGAEDRHAWVAEQLTPLLDARGVGLSESRELAKVAELRVEATLAEYLRLVEAQGMMKEALVSAGFVDPELQERLEDCFEIVDEYHSRVIVKGFPAGDLVPARAVYDHELAAGLDELSVGERRREAIAAALSQWLEARAALEREGAAEAPRPSAEPVAPEPGVEAVGEPSAPPVPAEPAPSE